MAIDMLSLFLLPMLIFIGVITSIEDYYHRKIRNKWILISLGYSLITVGAFYFFSKSETGLFIKSYALNLLFSSILSITFWGSRLWSAGDAKLFLALSSLLPPFTYSYASYYFPGIVLLCNILIPYVLYYVCKILLKTSWKMKVETLRTISSVEVLSSLLLFTFAFSWIGHHVGNLIGTFLPVLNSPITSIFFVVAFIVLVKDIFSMNLQKLCMGISAVALITDFNTFLQPSFLLPFGVVLFLAFFIRGFILNLGHHLLSVPVYLEDLKSGMLPAENLIQFGTRGVTIKKIRVLPFGILAEHPQLKGEHINFMISNPQEGILKKEVQKINQYHSEGFITFHTLRIYERVAFAPFLFAGSFITFLLGGKMIIWIALALFL